MANFVLSNISHIVQKWVLSPPFAIPPDKQYSFFKTFAFRFSVDAVENVTIKETLISV